MTTSLSTLVRLRAIQNKTRQLFEDMSDSHYRQQYHTDLSPAGWHLGHGSFIESYWLHEVISKDKSYADDSRLYVPENCPKPERGPRLPPLEDLINKVHQQQDENDLLLMEKIPPLSEHPLFKDEYIENFIIQHYAQHYETIHMVLTQIALQDDPGDYQPKHILQPETISRKIVAIDAGDYPIGGKKPDAYDNELPAFTTHLEPYNIGVNPLSNAEFLMFIEQGGYQDPQYWSEQGWQWREQNQVLHPDHWRQNPQSQWYGVTHAGAADLQADQAVYGISHYEASAFANWAQARLPHEHEWETASRQCLLQNTAQAWEWCANSFFPYQGYTPFPYDGYSKSWFDGKHYVLKGASPYTRADIKRASFRNFFQAHQRHIFAGLRLVFD